ncbi:MAG: Na+/H+ antiporter NhaC family protein [Bacteroidetes bacterium]|nr:MAG: Na+/H+ antiporter NhaC family protein [Bacteroidota bacterium]
MKNRFRIGILAICLAAVNLQAQNDTLAPTLPQPAPLELASFQIVESNGRLFVQSPGAEGLARVQLGGEPLELVFSGGRAPLTLEIEPAGALYFFEWAPERFALYHLAARGERGFRIRAIPLWLSLVPPLIAIGLALLFKEVLVSLFVGIWSGAFIAGGLRVESFYHWFKSLWDVVEHYIIGALNDSGHLSVLVFSALIGGMVAVISRNGGMAGVVKALSRYARTPRSSQFVTWLLGVAIFFDDYANTLIVGNTMRSVTDRFRISREKLAYIVDSTAAPVAAVAFITTWIGAELGYIGDGLQAVEESFPAGWSPYAVFLASLKYGFYPSLALIFILLLVFFNRDFGPMWEAENRARTTGQVAPIDPEAGEGEALEDLSPVAGSPEKARYAALPVLTVIALTVFGLVDTGMSAVYAELQGAGVSVTQSWGSIWGQMGAVLGSESGFFAKLGHLIGSSDSYVALLWASVTGVLVAMVMTLGGRIMKLTQVMSTLLTGFKTMLPALLILTLAWSLAATTEELHTADFLAGTITGNVSPYLLPPLVFVLAAVTSFSTGSSWSTMAILYPLVIPITWAVAHDAGIDEAHALELFFNVIAVTLGASVMGDHCSPISDTTILSSLASDCSHIEHVRTQLPYALVVGTVSLICVTVSAYLGGGWLLNCLLLAAAVVILGLLVRRWGRPVPE